MFDACGREYRDTLKMLANLTPVFEELCTQGGKAWLHGELGFAVGSLLAASAQ